ncbi:hypothetical protein Heshes_05110 [Alicyclobacillus hesperidum]|uniref:LysM repeat-containing protein n=1 Tax=Alicyclobacillus hesperidum TaxID=89784 RepID=A0A1H2Q3K4_9BACL|nr:LysM peptidoglycan-binding domain-containing protein [Alicyclobacillus hesperidum]GLV12827.1 hypothetical protein Heshes_05110 [Alicyclobacillus hesperidum]SDW01705.1 LysM repeat-containing protein [Alicyclobacillus hesperidum]
MKKYVVKPGESLYQISRKTGVRLPLLLAANPQIQNANDIVPGMTIVIPELGKPVKSGKAKKASSAKTTKQAKAKPYFGFVWPHHVQAGETWAEIAARYGVSVAQVEHLNPTVAGQPLQPGMIVYVPLSHATSSTGYPQAPGYAAPTPGYAPGYPQAPGYAAPTPGYAPGYPQAPGYAAPTPGYAPGYPQAPGYAAPTPGYAPGYVPGHAHGPGSAAPAQGAAPVAETPAAPGWTTDTTASVTPVAPSMQQPAPTPQAEVPGEAGPHTHNPYRLSADAWFAPADPDEPHLRAIDSVQGDQWRSYETPSDPSQEEAKAWADGEVPQTDDDGWSKPFTVRLREDE